MAASAVTVSFLTGSASINCERMRRAEHSAARYPTPARRERARILRVPERLRLLRCSGLLTALGGTLRKKGRNRGTYRTLVQLARNYREPVAFVDAFVATANEPKPR